MPSSTDLLALDASRAPRRDLATWLTGELRAGVLDGRLMVGTVLPPTRALAADLGIARGVVVAAYQRLCDEGLAVARPRVGTIVTANPRPANGTSGARATSRARSGRHVVMERHTAPPVEINLSPGLPELTHFPRAAWLRAEREVLAAAHPSDLGYGDPRGVPVLREQLAARLTRLRGLSTTADQLIVVSGVAQALSLLSHVLLRHGHHRIAVEDPCSRGARDTFAHWGLEPVGVPVDDDGIDVRRLEASGVDQVFVTPAHQFPSGVVLSPDRRKALLRWVVRHDGLIIEDDYDAEHRYDRTPVSALQAGSPGHVAHAGSTSKVLAPALRLGWLVPPPHLFAEVLDAKYASDLGSPVLPQLVLARMLTGGGYERHQRLARARQRERRDALVAALAAEAPEVHVGGVSAGLHVLATFPGLHLDTDDVGLAQRLEEVGVRVQPLSLHRLEPGPPGLVVGYGAHSPDRLREAARRIGQVVRASCGPAAPR